MTALHATDGETDERVGSNNPGPHTWLVLTDAGDPQPPCPIKAAEASSWEPKGNALKIPRDFRRWRYWELTLPCRDHSLVC